MGPETALEYPLLKVKELQGLSSSSLLQIRFVMDMNGKSRHIVLLYDRNRGSLVDFTSSSSITVAAAISGSAALLS